MALIAPFVQNYKLADVVERRSSRRNTNSWLAMLSFSPVVIATSVPPSLNYSAFRSLLQPVTACYSLSQPATACHSLLQPVTACYSLSQPATACYSLLQSATVCYSLLQPATACYSLLQSATACYSLLQPATACYSLLQPVTVCYHLLQPVTACYSLLQPATACYSLLQPATACYSLLQPATACYSLLQSATACYSLLKPATACYSARKVHSWETAIIQHGRQQQQHLTLQGLNNRDNSPNPYVHLPCQQQQRRQQLPYFEDVACNGCRARSQDLEQSSTTNNYTDSLSLDSPSCSPANQTLPNCYQPHHGL